MASKPAVKKLGKSLEEFRANHDKNYIVPQKIKAALAKLADSWEYEVDFIKTAGLNTVDISRFWQEFEEHVVLVKASGTSHTKRIWVGTKNMANKMREMVS